MVVVGLCSAVVAIALSEHQPDQIGFLLALVEDAYHMPERDGWSSPAPKAVCAIAVSKGFAAASFPTLSGLASPKGLFWAVHNVKANSLGLHALPSAVVITWDFSSC